ncbi:toll/interleukin-1 receptor domain-containing protein [Saccharothrix variisporea]|uniref:toll/interleukin-1 receptor domain-containing protein n=1 Tax=Saccharothrix variisporea TaxID=543527 RepID=UPI002482BFDA|nr:TIR domain-containing protein [Saccharothrix variisporea]
MSYTRNDEPTVQALRDDLERLHWPVWMDHEIHGGEQWWREIIQTIQRTRVFVFALSDASWRSRPCQDELDYAKRLGIPVLPVQVGAVHNTRIPIMETQAIDYRERTPEAVLALVASLADLASREVRLPDPLPDPPTVPFEYLYRMAERLGPKPIPADDQDVLIGQFRSKLRNEDDAVARADIVKLLKELRGRRELTVGNAEEIDSLLETAEPLVAAAAEDGATRLPPTDHWRQEKAQPEARSGDRAEPEAKPVPQPRRETPPPPVTPPPRAKKPDPLIPTPPKAEPPQAEPPEPEPPRSQPTTGSPGEGAPAWLRTLVTNGPSTQTPAPEPSTPTAQWWGAAKPAEPPKPQPVPESPKGRGFAFPSAVLGATGLPLLFLGAAREDRSVAQSGAVLLLVVAALGLSLALVSVAHKEPRSRAAAIIAAVGLAGAVVYAFSGVF